MSNKSQTQKRQVALCAVGGLVVSGAAIGIIVGFDVFDKNRRKSSLRAKHISAGSPEPDPSAIATSSPLSNPSPELSPSAPTATSRFDNIANSDATSDTAGPTSSLLSSSDRLVPSVVPTGVPTMSPASFPTHSLTATELLTEEVVEFSGADQLLSAVVPTVNSTDKPRFFSMAIELSDEELLEYSAIPLSTRSKERESGEGGFRMKLYWERGYKWQGSRKEKWWCMSCGRTCEEDEKIRLRDCKRESPSDARFILTHYEDGDQYRVSDTHLCLERVGTRSVQLKTCKDDTNYSRQLFVGYQPNKKFEVLPIGTTGRCLSNHHHPKAGESIYAETREKAHNAQTGYWVAD